MRLTGLNVIKDVKLFFARSLGLPMKRHFHASRCPCRKQKQATLFEFQYKSIGKTVLQARKLEADRHCWSKVFENIGKLFTYCKK